MFHQTRNWSKQMGHSLLSGKPLSRHKSQQKHLLPMRSPVQQTGMWRGSWKLGQGTARKRNWNQPQQDRYRDRLAARWWMHRKPPCEGQSSERGRKSETKGCKVTPVQAKALLNSPSSLMRMCRQQKGKQQIQGARMLCWNWIVSLTLSLTPQSSKQKV